jgi:hypothetical protein
MNQPETSHLELRDAIRELRATIVARLANIHGRKVDIGQVLQHSHGRTNEEALDAVVASPTRRQSVFFRFFRRKSKPEVDL